MSLTQLCGGHREICTYDHETGLGELAEQCQPGVRGGGNEDKQKQGLLINQAYLSTPCHSHLPQFLWSPSPSPLTSFTSHKLSQINFRCANRGLHRSETDFGNRQFEIEKARKEGNSYPNSAFYKEGCKVKETCLSLYPQLALFSICD